MGLLAELRRRNVLRMAGLYLVGAWLVVQVASTLLPVFEAPAWLLRSLVLLLAVGFVAALVFAWVFELTPEGLKREADVDRSQSITPDTGRRMDRVIIAALLVALGFFAVERFAILPARLARERADVPPPPALDAAPRVASNPNSIVVLPFVDMSQAKDQEYFSDGLAEELLNLLARIPQLRVISRSSAFSFKGRNVDVATIARQLDVAHVLEGSVRKAGNRVRITVQLIDATTDAHLWSETFDRPLDDVFAVQDEIAAAVVAKLKVELLGAAPTAEPTDTDAYALFLEARVILRRGSSEALQESIATLERALAIAPDYAPAWLLLGEVHLNRAARGMVEPNEGLRASRAAAERALALDSGLATADALLAQLAILGDRDLVSAPVHAMRAFARDPGNASVLLATGFTARVLGRRDMDVALHARLVALDPANALALSQLGKACTFAGDLACAEANYRKTIASRPGFVGVRHWLALVLLAQPGRAAEALALADDEPMPFYRQLTVAMAQHALGDAAASDAALATLAGAQGERAAYNLGYVHAFRGEPDAAFAALERAVQLNDSGLVELAVQPMFAPLHGDPRWPALLRRLGRDPEVLAKVEFHVELPTATASAVRAVPP